jgi:Dehydratase family
MVAHMTWLFPRPSTTTATYPYLDATRTCLVAQSPQCDTIARRSSSTVGRSNRASDMSIAPRWVTRREIPSISRTRSSRTVNVASCFAILVVPIDTTGRTFFQGAFAVGKITEEQRFDVVRHACPGPGACGGMYTYVFYSSLSTLIQIKGTNDVADSANTMSSALEVLGLSLPYSSSTPATYDGASHESRLRGPQLTFYYVDLQGSSKSVRGLRDTSKICSNVISSHGMPDPSFS